MLSLVALARSRECSSSLVMDSMVVVGVSRPLNGLPVSPDSGGRPTVVFSSPTGVSD